jgi:hypothetical protein
VRPQVVDEWRLTAFGGLKTTLWRIVDIVTIRYSCKKIFFSFYLESPEVTAGMRIDCVSPTRPLCGIYKSAPRWRKSANDGSKTSCALPHRSRGQVSVGFHGIKSKKKKESM